MLVQVFPRGNRLAEEEIDHCNKTVLSRELP